MTDQMNDFYDVAVIGGGAAGLNGALMLTRARRSVVVIDAGAPRNAPANGVHGLLGREGMSPEDLLERGRVEVRGYGGHIVSGEVVDVTRDVCDFVVSFSDGRVVRASRLLVTTGLVDELPDIEGLRDRWGRDVLHCPYCHGWEVRDQPIGVLGGSARSAHLALMLRQWSDDVVYFSHTTPPTGEEAGQLAARGVTVVDGDVESLHVVDDHIEGVQLKDGTLVQRQALFVPTRLVARANFLANIGLQPAEHPSGSGEHIPADPTGRTDVPGVWAAGNVTDLMAWVGVAAAAGGMAGAQINADLVDEDTRDALDSLAS